MQWAQPDLHKLGSLSPDVLADRRSEFEGLVTPAAMVPLVLTPQVCLSQALTEPSLPLGGAASLILNMCSANSGWQSS